jgi:hypothetical protein
MEESCVRFAYQCGARLNHIQLLVSIRALSPAVGKILHHVDVAFAASAPEVDYKLVQGREADSPDAGGQTAAAFATAQRQFPEAHTPPSVDIA